MSIHSGAEASVNFDGKTMAVSDLTASTDGANEAWRPTIRVAIDPDWETQFGSSAFGVMEVFAWYDANIRYGYENKVYNRRIRNCQHGWRRMKPGKWIRWTGWYVRNLETLETFPVLLTLNRWFVRRGFFKRTICLDWRWGIYVLRTGFEPSIGKGDVNIDDHIDWLRSSYPGVEFYKEDRNGMDR